VTFVHDATAYGQYWLEPVAPQPVELRLIAGSETVLGG
jgi:hypothetical protein